MFFLGLFATFEDICQFLSLDKLHGDKSCIAFFTIFINRNNAGMRQLSGSLGFAFESCQHFITNLGIEQIIANGFDGDNSFNEGIPCLVDYAHGSFAEHTFDFVFSQFLWDAVIFLGYRDHSGVCSRSTFYFGRWLSHGSGIRVDCFTRTVCACNLSFV